MNLVLLAHRQVLVWHVVAEVNLLAPTRCIIQADFGRERLRILVRYKALLTKLLERLLVRRVRHDGRSCVALMRTRHRRRLLLLTARHDLRRLHVASVALWGGHLRVRSVTMAQVRSLMERGQIILAVD